MAEQAEYLDLLSGEEYLHWESAQEFKYELLANRIYPMTGASRSHNFLSTILAVALYQRLGSQSCEIYTSDMRVQVDDGGTYTYPDVIVVCGEPRFRQDIQPDTLLNPTSIFEILSPSTELIDRNHKLQQYLAMDSLQACCLVSQNIPRVEAYSRRDEDWVYRVWTGLDEALVIERPDCVLPLAEIYAKIQL